MTDLDLELQVDLDRLYPPLEGTPDWPAVLARAKTKARTRRRRRPLLVGAGAALTVAVALVFAVSLSSNGVGFGQKALAAIGSGRYLDAELRPMTSPGSTIDLTTGRVAPIAVRWRVVYDTRTGVGVGTHHVRGSRLRRHRRFRPVRARLRRRLSASARQRRRSPAGRDHGRRRPRAGDPLRDHCPTASRTGRTSPSPRSRTSRFRVRYSSVDAHGHVTAGGTTFQVVRFASSDSMPALPRASRGFEGWARCPRPPATPPTSGTSRSTRRATRSATRRSGLGSTSPTLS